VKADTIRIHRRYFNLPPSSRTRASAAALFRVSRAAFLPAIVRARKSDLACHYWPIHPAVPVPFIHSIFRSQNSPADSPCNSHPTCSAPAAPQRTSAAVAGITCYQVPLPVATTVGRGSTPTAPSPFLLRRSRAQRQFDSRSRPSLLEGLSSIGGPSSRFPFRSATQPAKVTF
jgi:hypothetical protein